MQSGVGIGEQQKRPVADSNSAISGGRDARMRLGNNRQRIGIAPASDGLRRFFSTAVINNDYFKAGGIFLARQRFQASTQRRPIIMNRDDDAECWRRIGVGLIFGHPPLRANVEVPDVALHNVANNYNYQPSSTLVPMPSFYGARWPLKNYGSHVFLLWLQAYQRPIQRCMRTRSSFFDPGGAIREYRN